MASKFYALLTERGAVKLAAATALGNQVKITQMAVGDGNGVLPTPTASQTKLVNEKRRAALNSLTIDPANPSQIIAEQVIPEGDGGFWIREIGVYDDAGELIAVANCAETYKPVLAEGSGRTQVIRMVLIVSSTAAVTLKIDPSVVLATRKYVDDKVIEVKAYADDLMAKHLAAADPHTQYAQKASPTFTGTPKAPTPPVNNSSTQLATTAFVQAVIAQLVASSPAALDTLNELAAALGNDPNFATTMTNQLALKAPLASPALTGSPTAPTAAAATNNTQIATTAFVKAAIASLVASAPAALDTLNELAAALGDDPNFASTVTNALALKAPLANPAFSGVPTAPTAAPGTNSTQIATMAALLQSMSSNGLGDLAQLITDLNSPTSTLLFRFNGSAANSPLTGAGGNGVHIQYSSNTWTQIVITLAGSNSNLYNRVFTRICNAGTAGNWQEQARLESPAFTGTPTAPTAATGTASDQIATMNALLNGMLQYGIGGYGSTTPGYTVNPAAGANTSPTRIVQALGTDDQITAGAPVAGQPFGGWHVVRGIRPAQFGVSGQGASASFWYRGFSGATASQGDWLQVASIVSPGFTGTPTAPTAAANNNSTQIATTAFVKTAIASLVASAPGALDTLNELAAALGNDPNFATTITNLLAQKAPLANPSFTGSASLPATTVSGALAVSGGGAFGATLTNGYRQIFKRDGAIGYQAFTRSDVTSAPSVDTEMGRTVFGYGMSDVDSWGTGGILAYMNSIALANGGGKLQLVAHDAQLRGRAVISLDGNAGAISFTGDANFIGPISTAQKITASGGADFSGDVTAPTRPKSDNSTKVATTEFVQSLSVPVGVPVPWPSSTPPAGWLKCNGATFSATAYPELAKVYSTLKVPDLRGEFIRGWDDGRNVDSGRAITSGQAAYAGSLNIGSSTLKTTTANDGTPLLDILTMNGVTFNDENVTKEVVITPGDNRPRNVAFNYIVRAA